MLIACVPEVNVGLVYCVCVCALGLRVVGTEEGINLMS